MSQEVLHLPEFCSFLAAIITEVCLDLSVATLPRLFAWTGYSFDQWLIATQATITSADRLDLVIVIWADFCNLPATITSAVHLDLHGCSHLSSVINAGLIHFVSSHLTLRLCNWGIVTFVTYRVNQDTAPPASGNACMKNKLTPIIETVYRYIDRAQVNIHRV